jgi:hypothetical protein
MFKPVEDGQKNQPQGYDSSLKDFIEQQAQEILPQLLPGVTYERTINIEMIRPAVRADKAYRVRYYGEEHVLHIEFESGADARMADRLLAYNGILHLDHDLPVLSMIIYPFSTTIAQSPLRVKSGKRDLVTFHFEVLPLFTLDAERYVFEQVHCMYPLLPTMQNVHHTMIKQVMGELAELYREDEVTLSQQFVWMKLLLNRTDTILDTEKEKIKEVLNMYNRLWDEDPDVQKERAVSKAEGKAEGKTEGKAEGKAEGIAQAVLLLVKARFPRWLELAQQKAKQTSQISDLDMLVEQLAVAADEDTARRLLAPPQ